MQKVKAQNQRAIIRACALFCLLSTFCLLPFSFNAADDSGLLEMGKATRLRTPAPSPSEIKVVSYNIRWRSGDDLQQIIYLLRNDPEIGGASVIGLQEVDRHKKRSGYTNTARAIAEDLGMHYAWAAPPKAERSKDPEEETGVAILSLYPLADVERMVLPNEGPGGRRRVALGATIRVGTQDIRVYTVHAETRISTEKRLEQFRAVLDDLKRRADGLRAIVLGDFNTTWPRDVNDTSRLFTQAGFVTPFPEDKATWKTLILELKLDWIWLKGLRPGDYGIDKKVGYSDHWPLWVKVNMGGAPLVPADIRGKIVRISRAATGHGGERLLGTVLIESTGESGTKFDKALVRVTTDTRVAIMSGREGRRASLDALKVGDRVEARFTGPVMESYPVQATASEITVLQ